MPTACTRATGPSAWPWCPTSPRPRPASSWRKGSPPSATWPPSPARPPAGEYHGPLAPAPGQEARLERLRSHWQLGGLDRLTQRARALVRARDRQHAPGTPRRRIRPEEPAAPEPAAPVSEPAVDAPFSTLPDESAHPGLVKVFFDAQHDYLRDGVYLLAALVVGPEGERVILEHTTAPVDPAAEGDLLERWVPRVYGAVVAMAGTPEAFVHLYAYSRQDQSILLAALRRHVGRLPAIGALFDLLTDDGALARVSPLAQPMLSFLAEELRDRRTLDVTCTSLHAVATRMGFRWQGTTPAGRPADFQRRFRARVFDGRRLVDLPPRPSAVVNGRQERNGRQGARGARAAHAGSRAPPASAPRSPWSTPTAPGGPSRPPRATCSPASCSPTPAPPGTSWRASPPTACGPSCTWSSTWAPRAAPPASGASRYWTSPGPASPRQGSPAPCRTSSSSSTTPTYRSCSWPTPSRWSAGCRRGGRCSWSAWSTRASPGDRPAPAGASSSSPSASTPSSRRKPCASRPGPGWWSTSSPAARPTGRAGLRPGHLPQALPRPARAPGHRGVHHPPKPQTGDSRRALRVTLALKPLSFGDRVFAYTHRGAGRHAPRVPLHCGRDGGRPQRGQAPRRLPGRRQPRPAPQPPPAVDRQGRASASRSSARHAAAAQDPAPDRDAPAPAPASIMESLLQTIDAVERAAGAPGPTPRQREAIAGVPLRPAGPFSRRARSSRLAGAPDPGPPRQWQEPHPGLDGAGPPRRRPPLRRARLPRRRQQQDSQRHPDRPRQRGPEAGPPAPPRPPLALRPGPRPSSAWSKPGAPAGKKLPNGRPSPRPPPRERPPKKRRRSSPSIPTSAGTRSRPSSAAPWLVLGATPGGLYSLQKYRPEGGRDVPWDERPFHLVVLDEASQVNVPEALLACAFLRPEGRAIVVGDHRQMPPIVAVSWNEEARRTVVDSEVYRSVFDFLRARPFPRVGLDQSFRLPSRLAAFLEELVYRQDGIPFYSRRQERLPPCPTGDPYVDAVLHPAHPVVVVEHEESASHQVSPVELELLTPILHTCTEGLQPGRRHGDRGGGAPPRPAGPPAHPLPRPRGGERHRHRGALPGGRAGGDRRLRHRLRPGLHPQRGRLPAQPQPPQRGPLPPPAQADRDRLRRPSCASSPRTPTSSSRPPSGSACATPSPAPPCGPASGPARRYASSAPPPVPDRRQPGSAMRVTLMCGSPVVLRAVRGARLCADCRSRGEGGRRAYSSPSRARLRRWPSWSAAACYTRWKSFKPARRGGKEHSYRYGHSQGAAPTLPAPGTREHKRAA